MRLGGRLLAGGADAILGHIVALRARAAGKKTPA